MSSDLSKTTFSPSLISHLQSSPTSDQTRSADQDLHLQQRVNAELQRLSAEADSTLRALLQPPSSSAPSVPPQPEDIPTGPSRATIQAEINTLKKRLTNRRSALTEDDEKKVEDARQALVGCLREKGRVGENGEEGRMLDCWAEVEGFKREVGRVEGVWLGRRR